MNILTRYKDLLMESLKDNKKLILILYAVFIAIFIIGWVLVSKRTEIVANAASSLSGSDSATIGEMADIFITNAGGALYVYFGSILFGLVAIISLGYNAFIAGSWGPVFSVAAPNGALHYIAYVIPHGIFEITATVIEAAAGLLLFYFIFKFVKGIIKGDGEFKEKMAKSYEDNKRIFIQSFVLLVFAIILLIIAAPIETFVSVPISNLLTGPIP